jgi:ABC-type lipoprotein export system ATPase subunit
MGVCPQFDTLWETLTAEETILFYCRLKGISKSDEKEETAALLKQVGLYESRYKLVKELSGVCAKPVITTKYLMSGNEEKIIHCSVTGRQSCSSLSR